MSRTYIVLYYFDQFVCHASHAKWFWTNSVACPASHEEWSASKNHWQKKIGGNLLVGQITYPTLKWLAKISGWSQVTRQLVGAKTSSTSSQVTPPDELIEIVQ